MNKREKANKLLTQAAKAVGAKQFALGEAELDFPLYRGDKTSILKIELTSPWKEYDGKKVHLLVYVD